jgi:hypothetical protein
VKLEHGRSMSLAIPIPMPKIHTYINLIQTFSPSGRQSNNVIHVAVHMRSGWYPRCCDRWSRPVGLRLMALQTLMDDSSKICQAIGGVVNVEGPGRSYRVGRDTVGNGVSEEVAKAEPRPEEGDDEK